MKKIISMIIALAFIASISVTAFAAEDMYAGNGETQIQAHVYSRYSISIPATIDLRNGDMGEVTISDADIEDDYSVKVFLTNATSPNGITLTHTNGMSTIECSIINIEENTIANENIPIVSFTNSDIEQGTGIKYFSLQPENYGKAGDYNGTMQYRFECLPNQ